VRGWTSICRALPFRGRRRSNSQPALNGPSHSSVLIGDGFETTPSTSDSKPEGRGGPIKKTVRKLMRRASHSFRPGNEKGPLVVSGPGRKGRGKGRALMGDAESGIVLDEKDVGDNYYCVDALMKRVGMRDRHLPECGFEDANRLGHEQTPSAAFPPRSHHRSCRISTIGVLSTARRSPAGGARRRLIDTSGDLCSALSMGHGNRSPERTGRGCLLSTRNCIRDGPKQR